MIQPKYIGCKIHAKGQSVVIKDEKKLYPLYKAMGLIYIFKKEKKKMKFPKDDKPKETE